MKEQEQKTIIVKRQGAKGLIQYVEQLEAAINEGWKVVYEGRQRPRLNPLKAVLTKDGKPVEKTVPKREDEVPETPTDAQAPAEEKVDSLESLTKKDELLSFASEKGIEVPEDVKMPKAIKKHIEESLKDKE